MLDIVNTILRELIAVATSDDRVAGIATVVCFSILGFILIGLSPLALCFTTINPLIIIAWLMQLVTVVLYFYGDNIGFILERYGETLGCGDMCIENNRIASVVLLGSAMVVWHIIPPLLKDIAVMVKDEYNYKHGGWYYALDMLALLIRVDTTFTVIAIMSQTTAYCSLSDRTLGWSFFVILTVIGIAGLIISSIYTAYKIDNESTIKSLPAMSATLIIVVILLGISLPLYILADNQQPLDCVWGCDSYSDNATAIVAANSGINCNMKANSGLRLGFMTATCAFVLLSLALLGCDWRIEHVV